MQTLTHAYLNAMRQYFEADGRATRTELFLYLVAVAGILLGSLVVSGMSGAGQSQPVFWLLLFAHLIPTLTIVARRLHDSNNSAWWVLVGIVPYIGPLILLLWMLTPSNPGQNKFGPPSYVKRSTSRVEPPIATVEPQPPPRTSPTSVAAGQSANKWAVAPKLPGEMLIKVRPETPKVEVLAPVPKVNPTEKRAQYDQLRESGMLSEAEYLRLIKSM